MNTGIQGFQTALRLGLQMLWKRRWLGVAVAWAVALLAAPAVWFVPNRFEASAQVYVDTQTVLKPLLQGLAYTPDVEQQVRMLARTLISRPNVEQLIARPDLKLGPIDDYMTRERTITRLIEKIRFASVQGTNNLYSLAYRDTDATRARDLVEAIVRLFVESSAQGKRRDSEEARRFIDEQIQAYESKLVEAENRLKDFKLRNFGVSGVSDRDHFARMSMLSEEVSKLRVDLGAAEQARDALKRELAGENPQLPPDAAPAAAPPLPSETETRLDAQRRLLDELLRKYTDAHPDVTATQRLIAQLEAQKRREAQDKAAAFAAGGGKGQAATSPVYQRLRVSLAEAEAQVASLRSQLTLTEARLNEARRAATRMPQIEADLAQLNRDYDIINKQYQGLVARRESASLGVKLDEDAGLAVFRIVEPARVEPKPVVPSRVHVAAMVALGAILLGIAAPFIAEYVFPTFRDTAELARVSGRQVLGAIPLAVTPGHERQMRREGIGVATASSVLVLLQVVWLLFLSGRLPV